MQLQPALEPSVAGQQPPDNTSGLLRVLRGLQRGRQLRPVLANSTSVGMQPNVQETPVPEVNPCVR